MKLSQNNILELTQKAILAAQKAGSFIAQYNHNSLEIKLKANTSSRTSAVVTEVDLKCQEIIFDILLPTLKEYDLAILSEETIDSRERLRKDYFWSIDPLDGTLSYIDNEPGYAVSIALVSKKGNAIMGVVYDPSKRVLIHSIENMGVFVNLKKWKPTLNTNLKKQNLLVAFDRSFKNDPIYESVISQLNSYVIKQGYNSLEILKPAGGVINSIMILQNGPGCYFKFPKPKGGSIWDYSATSSIYKESSAIVTDIYGDELDLNREDSTYLNHKGFIYATDIKIAKWISKLYKQYL